MSKLRLFLVSAFALIFTNIQSQSIEMYPTHWWVGMKMNTVQVLIKSSEADFNTSSFTINYPGVTLSKVHTFENGKYAALDLVISNTTAAGNVKIQIKKGKKTKTFEWPLKTREGINGETYAQGVTAKDFIYLALPDRFSNGDPANDRIAGMRDQTLNRDSIYHRHGGDLQGIINHVDYLENMGVTALWLMPVLENDRTERTEHGYAFTNHYKVDPRLGGNMAYKNLSKALHAKGMKLIQDAVYNHADIDHILFRDKPAADWFHQWPSYTQTSYKDQPVFDPYGSAYDKKRTQDGWFTEVMPDWNHNNPYVANFLIQHAIWCVEEFGVDGWRIDTYLYNDLPFMNRCNAALLEEYPKLSIFGELWVHGIPSQAYFVDNNINTPGFKSNLPGTTDFQTLFYGIVPALTEKFGWTEGVNKLYTTLSFDFVYKDPYQNVIFLDNHDISRFFSVVGENVAKQKIGLQWLLTCRGIPQLYYGTEVLMKGFTNPDGWVRLDFPGGWQGDKKNGFTGEGLSENEKEVQQLVRTLANFRKKSSALTTGKMMQYVPQDGLYVYFRYDDQQTIMCIMNTSDKELAIDFDRFKERTESFSKGVDIVSNQEVSLQTKANIAPLQMWTLELRK